MSVKNILAPLFLISSILAVSTTYAADAEHTGDDTVTLANVFGLHPTGTPYPAMDGACKTQLQEDIGKTVETKYKINPSTLIMSAIQANATPQCLCVVFGQSPVRQSSQQTPVHQHG